MLLAQLTKKMLTVNWSAVKVSTAKEKLLIFSRLSRAYASGEYKALPWKSVMTILAAIIYFMNPVDLIPDFIPGIGLTDDFGVLIWVYNALSAEIDRFLEWEKSTVQIK
jgi:uncharacterized membrane protein YkvA (DUF1232 family)